MLTFYWSKIPTNRMLSFVEDTKLKQAMRNEEDVQSLQEELNHLYDLAEANNMVFNGTKFQLVRYGQDEQIKNDTLYFTENTQDVIERFGTLRNLGVIMSETATFDAQFDDVSKKVRQKIGWVLRTFYCRKQHFMKSIYKTIISPHIDYCSQLWMPTKATGILTVEKLQKDFFNKVPALKDLNYWEQLTELKMLSIQRRQERYRIIYTWKILEGLAPNCGITADGLENRQGRKCTVPKMNNKSSAAVKTMKDQTFQVHGPQLFNSLPAYLRNTTKCTVDDFKMKLDKFLERIPDEPSVRGLTPAGCTADACPSNSVLDQVKRIPGLMRGPGVV